MSFKILHTTPVLSSADIKRDVQWYKEKLGFTYYMGQEGYAVIYRDNQWLHLQWHANTDEDPVYGGTVKFFVNDIEAIFSEMQLKRVVTKDKLRRNTPWGTHEFGFYDLNNNAIFFVQDA